MNNNQLQRNFLIEFEEKGYDLNQFETYHNFLIECSQKDYNEIGTHEHHILPKGFMEGSDKKQNLIQLSYQDHYNAHLILAECFQKGDKNRGYNYASAKLIVGWVKQYLSKRYENISEQWEGFWDLAHKEVSELNRGENHPQYGDKYSPEKCKEMSDRMKGKMVGELNPFYGKRHTEETKAIIREKRANQTFSEESRQKSINALLNCITRGEDNPNFGKTWEEIHGIEKATLMRERMKIKSELRKDLRPLIQLPEGLFRCNHVEPDGKVCNIMRYCPSCNCEMFYKINEIPSNFNRIINNNPKCRTCNAKLRSKPLPELKIPERNTNRNILIMEAETGKIFNSINEYKRLYDIRATEFKKLITDGKLIIIKDNYNKQP